MNPISIITLAEVSTPVWITIYAGLGSIATVLVSLLVARWKKRSDDFSSFMNQSSDFRNEVLKELERKKKEYEKEIQSCKALVESQSQLVEALKNEKIILNQIPQLLWYADKQGRFSFFNQRWYEYTGLSFDLSVDKGWLSVLHLDDRAKANADWFNAVKNAKPLNAVYRIRSNEDGQYRAFLLKAVPIFDAYGRVSQWIGSYTDIADAIQSNKKK